MNTNNSNKEEHVNPLKRLQPIVVGILVLLIFSAYSYAERKNTIHNTEDVATRMADYISSNIANEIDYAKSNIKLSSVMISQTMTSNTLENPAQVIGPMVENSPFENIEYIRADGMNVMNIGEPFDASDRVYYTEGIKGNTGIWNNYHPKTSKETLVNFYTPLMYDGQITGVITGYIAANSQLVPLFETNLFGRPIHGVLIDENNMVICSTIESEYVKDLTLDMFLDQLNVSESQKKSMSDILSSSENATISYKDPSGEGRICVSSIKGTEWKTAIIVPASSFNGIINDNAKSAVFAISAISILLILYAAQVLVGNARRRKELSDRNAKLEEDNLEIRDIIASANMGTWRIELIDGKDPRMIVDDTMKGLLGIEGKNGSPEETYNDWYSNIKPEAVDSVLRSVEKMEQGQFDENTYLWIHPTKGERYVRCGGTSVKVDGGYILRGYHYDVDDVVREEQAQIVMLQNTIDEKNEYYATLGALGDAFYSMHVVDLKEDSVVEFSAKNNVKTIVNHKYGAKEMMTRTMHATMTDAYIDEALEFTDLSTIAERMKGKKIISKELLGNNIGWIQASFVVMEKDEEGTPTKIIITTRSINEDKKQKETLIKKSQTDELTGLYNRRSYEEDIYEHNDIPSEDDFIYISLDVNGLKVVNDTKGHMAGDELIIGACHCMKISLAPYGKLYRTGGDEFVAILFCDANKLKEILDDFDTTISNWSGRLVDGLSISYGWIAKEEEPSLSVRQLGAIAEQRMYEAKSAHYKKSGVDRRGQQEAHKALCELYTKILKINITNDTYQIVNMDETEQSKDKGFADSISEWLISFCESGYVHSDDMEEYLRYTDLNYMRKYFMGSKTSLNIFYRRKFSDGFKQVMMEIIRANDYSNDNQNLYLYVKNIDK